MLDKEIAFLRASFALEGTLGLTAHYHPKEIEKSPASWESVENARSLQYMQLSGLPEEAHCLVYVACLEAKSASQERT